MLSIGTFIPTTLHDFSSIHHPFLPGLFLCDLYFIQVALTDPVIAKQKQNAPPPNPKLNTQNNIEWRLELKPEETRSITVQYTVEFPTNKQVEGL